MKTIVAAAVIVVIAVGGGEGGKIIMFLKGSVLDLFTKYALVANRPQHARSRDNLNHTKHI